MGCCQHFLHQPISSLSHTSCFEAAVTLLSSVARGDKLPCPRIEDMAIELIVICEGLYESCRVNFMTEAQSPFLS